MQNRQRAYSYIIVLFTLMLWLLAARSPLAESSGNVVARIGDTVLTEADLQDALEHYKPSGTFHTEIDRSKSEFRKAALNDLIERELLSLEAVKKGIRISDEAVDSAVQYNIKHYGSEDKFKEALKMRGVTIEALKERIRKYELARTLLEELSTESAPSDDEVRKHYEENRSKFRRPDAVFLYHILIQVEPTASDKVWQEKQKFAEQLLEKIRKGADFGQIAYQYSDDPYKYKSGEIGFVHRGRLTPQELEDVAFGLKKGEVSGVIRTIYGFHILKAGEKIGGEIKPFAEVKVRLKKEMQQSLFEEKKKALLDRLRKEYPVTISSDMNGMANEK